MRNCISLAVLPVLFFLSGVGCAVGPDYVPPEVEKPDAWRVDYEGAAEVSNIRWWEQFDDPVLNALIDDALKENWDVRIAAARMEEFAARVDMARSQFFPQLGYSLGGNRTHISLDAGDSGAFDDRTFTNYDMQGQFNWELDLWGRIRRSNEAARAELLAQEENRRSVILSLVSAVARTYVALRQLDRQLEVAKETLELRAESLRLFELKFHGGVVSELEVAQIRTNYEQSAAAIPPIERDIALAENVLSVLLGRNPNTIPRGKTIDELILPAVPEGLPSTLLIRRPDIRSAEHTLIAANAKIGVARAQYFPTISLTGFLGYTSDSLSGLFGDASKLWRIGGAAMGPIFAGGGISAQVRASEAVQRQALLSYLQTVQMAFREVNDSLISVQKNREQLVVQGRRVKALSDYARMAELRYDGGYASYIEVLDAERFLFDAQLQYVQLQGEVYASLVNTYKAMGGGWIIEAQTTADEIDFPESQKRPFFDFPPETSPQGNDSQAGYQSSTR